MVTRNYVVLIRDEDGNVIDSAEADTEFARMRERITDLELLLDHARRIALEANQKLEAMQ